MSNKVLVVDRDEVSCLALEQALESWGYEPVFAHDLSSALVAFEATKPRALILAVDQPEAEGRAVFQAVRSREDGRLVEALFVTTRAHLGSIPPRAKEDAVFLRPLDVDAVVGRLMSTIGAPRIAPRIAEEKATMMPGRAESMIDLEATVDPEIERAEQAAKAAAADAFDESMENYERELARVKADEKAWAEQQRGRVTRNLTLDPGPDEDPTEANLDAPLPTGWKKALGTKAPVTRSMEPLDAVERWPPSAEPSGFPPAGFGFDTPTSVHGAIPSETEQESPADRVALLSRLESSGVSGSLIAEIDPLAPGGDGRGSLRISIELCRGRISWSTGPAAERTVANAMRGMGSRIGTVAVGPRMEFLAWAESHGFPKAFVDAVAFRAIELSLVWFVEHALGWTIERHEVAAGAPWPWRSRLADGLAEGPPRFRGDQRFNQGARPWRREDPADALLIASLGEGLSVEQCARLFELPLSRVAAMAWIACAEGALVELNRAPLEQGEVTAHVAETVTRLRPRLSAVPAPHSSSPSPTPPPPRSPSSVARIPQAPMVSLPTSAPPSLPPPSPAGAADALSAWTHNAKSSDYFAALGLPRTADTPDVERAARTIRDTVRAVRALGTASARDIAKEAESALEEALAILMDPELRQAYGRYAR
ncbi:MAG: hypothetical protein U1E65_10005 [Myxococcota bacterium]